MSDEILRIINTYDDEVAKARTLKYGCQPTWADAKSKAVKSLSTLLSQELTKRDEEWNKYTDMHDDAMLDQINELEDRLKEMKNDSE